MGSALARMIHMSIRDIRPLYVEESGGGKETVVFLHGLAGSCRFWNPLLDYLSPTRRAIAPDMLGFGRSPWPDVDYTVDAHLEILERDVFSRISGRYHLVGHSTGAALALAHAGRHPERVRSLGLMALPYFESADSAGDELGKAGGWPWLMLHAPRLSHALCLGICSHRDMWQHVMPALVPQFPRDVVYDGMLHSFHSISSTMDHCIVHYQGDTAAQRALAGGVRVAQLFDEHDELLPFSRARLFHERYPATAFITFDRGGHAFPLLAPAETARLLDGWLDGQPGDPQVLVPATT